MSDPIDGAMYRRPTSAEPEQLLTPSAVHGEHPPVQPCPSWCDDLTEHHQTHDTAAVDGSLVRHHSLDVGSVDGETLRSVGYVHASASVDVVAEEQLRDLSSSVVLGRPRVALWAEYVLLDAAQARQVAALLVTAAEQLDAIVGA